MRRPVGATSPLVLVAALLVVACGGPARPAPAPSAAGTTAPTGPTAARAGPPAELGQVHFTTAGWRTDFSRHSVPLGEIRSGGPPRDGIPPLDQPKFVAADEAARWLSPREPVIAFTAGGLTRAYPLQILIWHEIVNDEVGGVPVAVTFCPLCNTALPFDRRVAGQTLDFGTTGNLRNSDLIMWDRQTESWWQQFTGEAIVGALAGRRLTPLPATIVAWQDFRRQFPRAQVLSHDTGYARPYGTNPYVGYDKVDEPPFLFDGTPDGRLPPKARVVTVSLGGEDVAYPYTLLAERRVIADTVGGQALVVFYQPGTVSALAEADIAGSRDVGAAGVYRPVAAGRALTFTWRDGAFVDAETGSRWDVLGRATDGPLAGQSLAPVLHGDDFWFAWAAFKPQTRIYTAGAP